MTGVAPLVSLGVPVFQGERFLAATLESLLAQTYRDFELLLSDNGSTDRTWRICEEFAARDARIRLMRSPTNRGAAWNYNRVADEARGQYFKWAAADDLCAPTYLERCLDRLEADDGLVLAYPRTLIIDAEGRELRAYADQMHLVHDSPVQRFRQVLRALGECNAVFGLIRRSVLQRTRRIGPFPSSDLVLVGELALRGRFFEVPEPLFLRREHEAGSMRVHPDARDRVSWFDPRNAAAVRLPMWRVGREYLRAVMRAPLAARERLGCLWSLWWWPRRKYPELFGELLDSVYPLRGR